MFRSTFPLLRASLVGVVALWVTGCATVTGTPTQSIHIQTEDATGRPISGMRCRVVNGSAEYFGDSPMFNLQVRRSASDLEIECRRGALVARGTAVSRGTMVADALKTLLPGGTAMLVVDHVSGYRYSYPTWVRLRAGQHLVFDADHETGPGRPTPGMQAELDR